MDHCHAAPESRRRHLQASGGTAGFSCHPVRTRFFSRQLWNHKKKRRTSGSLTGDLPTYSATAGAQCADVRACVRACVLIRVTCARGTAVASHPVTSRPTSDAVPPLCPAVFLFVASCWPLTHTARGSSARQGFPLRHLFHMLVVGPSC